MYFDLARVLITSTPLWLLNLRATSWANHHKTDYYAKSGLIDFCGTGELEYLECCFGRRESAKIGFPCMAQQDPSSSYSTRLAAFTTTPLSTRREVLPRHTDLLAPATRPAMSSVTTMTRDEQKDLIRELPSLPFLLAISDTSSWSKAVTSFTASLSILNSEI